MAVLRKITKYVVLNVLVYIKEIYHTHMAIREGKYLVTYGDNHLTVFSLKNGQLEIKKNFSFASSIASGKLWLADSCVTCSVDSQSKKFFSCRFFLQILVN